MIKQIPPEVQETIATAVTWLFDKYGKDIVSRGTERVKNEAQWRLSIEQYYTSLFERVGFVRILGRMESEPLENVFTDVNVLDRPSAERRYDISRLMEEFGPRDFTAHERTERLPGQDALIQFPKMFILGKPGAGKTTFLKHTALRAIKHKIEKVPIFVSLKELSDSEKEIVPFIAHQFEVHRFPNPQPFVEDLLKDGEAIVLFDGLDEVNLADEKRATMIRWLNDFVYQYGDCPIVVTCRVAATDYSFTQFEYVEMADFDEEQISVYIDQWFVGDEGKRLGCRKALLEDKENEAVRELAQVPLLLALLCLVYEERNEFPPERHEIYEEATRALLSKWDASRDITRDTVYEKLTLVRKQGLLGQLAARNFEEGVYFIKERDIARQIEQYLAGVPGLEDPAGDVVLQSMEAQHGILVERALAIHSFSHLTLQEYFTARYIVANESRGPLQILMAQVGDDRWSEVFLLVAGLLDEATAFCEAYLDAARKLVAGDADLVGILAWAAQKGARLDVEYKPAAVRAFLLSRARDLASARDLARKYEFGVELAQRWQADELVADLRLLGAPPTLEEEDDVGLVSSWLARFSELLEPYRNRWDPYRQMPVSEEEVQPFDKLDEQQLDTWRSYLQANRLLQRCLQVAYVPGRAAVEAQMLLPPR